VVLNSRRRLVGDADAPAEATAREGGGSVGDGVDEGDGSDGNDRTGTDRKDAAAGGSAGRPGGATP
jgi:hypothetical protein